MGTDKNTSDIELLNNKPSALLEQYQYIIEAVVTSFLAKGFFSTENKMDIVQIINTQLLEKKLARIQEHYNGAVLLTTYFSKVVYNSCLELTRKQKRQPHLISDDYLQHHTTSSLNAFQKMAIQDELYRLEAILKSFYKKRTKTLLSLKGFARIILTNDDLGEYRVREAQQQLAMIRTTLFETYDDLNDKAVYEILVMLFNKVENKNNDGDSLRKWTTIVMDKVIRHLNGHPPTGNHNRESLKVLMQMYFKE